MSNRGRRVMFGARDTKTRCNLFLDQDRQPPPRLIATREWRLFGNQFKRSDARRGILISPFLGNPASLEC